VRWASRRGSTRPSATRSSGISSGEEIAQTEFGARASAEARAWRRLALAKDQLCESQRRRAEHAEAEARTGSQFAGYDDYGDERRGLDEDQIATDELRAMSCQPPQSFREAQQEREQARRRYLASLPPYKPPPPRPPLPEPKGYGVTIWQAAEAKRAWGKSEAQHDLLRILTSLCDDEGFVDFVPRHIHQLPSWSWGGGHNFTHAIMRLQLRGWITAVEKFEPVERYQRKYKLTIPVSSR
jgi:hypothetical protein